MKSPFSFLFILFLLIWVPVGNAFAHDRADEFDCVLEPNMTVELSTAVPGLLDTVHVKRGDQVRKGQVLARLKSGVEKASVEVAKARAASKLDIKTKQVQLALNKRNLKRVKELFKKKMVPKNEYDEAEAAAIVAELEVLQSEEIHQLAKLELLRADEILKLRNITSPINGVVVERFKSPGEHVEDQPILKLAQVNPLNVEVILPLSWLDSIKPGMEAKILPEKPVGGSYTAVVKIVDPVVDASSGTFGVRLELPNPRHRISAGLRCDVRFSVSK